MKDQFQRTIDYARISITDRCNLYCTYCRPDHEEMLSHGEILRYEEILRVCKILTTLGIDKFKITGGEPLVRKGCSDFIRELKKTDGVNKVTLTTNAILLSKDLVKLAEAGVDGINISLDFMDQEKYKKITGFDGYKQVIWCLLHGVRGMEPSARCAREAACGLPQRHQGRRGHCRHQDALLYPA